MDTKIESKTMNMRIAYTKYGCIYHFDWFDIKAFYSGKESDCNKFKHDFSSDYFSTFNEALNEALKYLKKKLDKIF